MARLYKSDRLSDPGFLDRNIKNISDDDLICAINEVGFPDVSAAVQSQDLEAWIHRWTGEDRPRYMTKTDRLFSDTDLIQPHSWIGDYYQRHPGERDELLLVADRLVEREICTWGDEVRKFAEAIDFNADLNTVDKYGFHYWLWARPLNVAAFLTGEKKYVRSFGLYVDQWYEQRALLTGKIDGLDVIYNEIGLALRSRVLLEHLMLPGIHPEPATFKEVAKTLLGSGRWLAELYKTEEHRPGNVSAGGALGLVAIALGMPEFSDSGNWLEIALSVLDRHAESDFFEDGGHVDGCPRNRGLAAYMIYRNLNALLTLYKVEDQRSARYRALLEKCQDWWVKTASPAGELPAVNDSARGPFPVSVVEDARRGGNRKHLDWLRNGGAEEPPAMEKSVLLRASGMAVMRDRWSPDAHYMSINFTPHSGPHSHAAVLDFELYAGSTPLAIDAGFWHDPLDQETTDWYRHAKAHNALVIDDRDPDRAAADAQISNWYTSEQIDFISVEHSGYCALGVTHRRNVLSKCSEYWIVNDRLELDAGGHRVAWYMHTPLPVEGHGRGCVAGADPGLIVLPGGRGLGMSRGVGPAVLRNGGDSVARGQANWVAFEADAPGPGEFGITMLLLPFCGAAPEVAFEENEEGAILLKMRDARDFLFFTPGKYLNGTIQTDAEAGLLRFRQEKLVGISILNGTHLAINDNRVIDETGRGNHALWK